MCVQCVLVVLWLLLVVAAFGVIVGVVWCVVVVSSRRADQSATRSYVHLELVCNCN